LRDHFAAGRITPGEPDERLSAALNPKIFGVLRRIIADLPGPVPALLGVGRRPHCGRRPPGPSAAATRPSRR
jgi:hypothetical protein